MAELKCELEQFQGRIIFMSMFNDIVWGEKGNEDHCMANSMNVATYARKFPLGCWSFLGPNGDWNRVAEKMMINFAECGHPIFQATSPLGSGELKNKSGGKKTIHHNGSYENVELILRTIISANQLSIYRAVADLCKEIRSNLC